MAVRALTGAAALGLLLAGCTGSSRADRAIQATTTTRGAATTTPSPPSYPLTGVLQPDPARQKRPALVVKVDNVAPALPQAGVDGADLVYEEMVESQLTRLVAVYQSADAPRIGPVRSVRTTDLDVAAALNYPLFGYSGGNTGFVAQLRASPVVDVGAETYKGAYFNSGPHETPHSLYTTTASLYGLARTNSRPPAPQFVYRAAGTPAAGAGVAPATHVDVNFGDTVAAWDWDPTSQRYQRSQDGLADVLQSGVRISTANVIVEEITYVTDGYATGEGIDPPPPIPKGITVGSGTAVVLTGGTVTRARWSKASPTSVTEFTDAAGQPIHLTPGPTWVELAPVGTTPTVR